MTKGKGLAHSTRHMLDWFQPDLIPRLKQLVSKTSAQLAFATR